MAIKIGHNNMPLVIKDLKFEDIKIGDRADFDVTPTFDDIKKFAEISGDYNPLHTDENYSSNTQFEKPVVHGMFLAALLSRLVGMYLPGKNSLYLSQNLNFKNPAFPNEKLLVEGVVIAKSDSTKIITLETKIKNQSGEIILDGEAKVKIL